MESSSHDEPVQPTREQDELFILHVKNFLEARPSHQRVLADAFLLALPTVERWSRGRNLPDSLSLRVRVMGWIWNHNCKCECS